MYNGIINIYKEAGFTSFDVVAKLRGILKQKKIGHTGTLDPLAEGVLLVCLGKATKLADMITTKNKEYEAVMQLGLITDTEDISGKVLDTKPVSVSKEKVVECINSFIGDYEQIPPMYSAIKINGKKLYEYARQGIEIEREKRPVKINDINILEVNLPYVRFDVNCSKGTYIRSLCRDIGDKLGCGAVMTELIRKEVNGYYLKDSLKLSEVEKIVKGGDICQYIYPMDTLISSYPAISVKAGYEKYLFNGNKLKEEYILNESGYEMCEFTENRPARVYFDNEFLALYKYDKSQDILKPVKMFLEK